MTVPSPRFASSLSQFWSREWALVALAGALGVLMAGVAMAFILPLRWLDEHLESIVRHDATSALLIIALAPTLGALLAGVVRRAFPPTTPLHGVAAVMYSIHRNQARLPLSLGIGKWLASTCTIGGGGSAGPEGPIVAIGGSFGSWIGQKLRLPPESLGTILGAAAAAGMASVFNAPIAGIFFVLEILLRDFSLRTFTPVVIAAVISSATTQAVLGSTPLFGVDPSIFTAQDVAFTLLQVPNYIVLGAACGAFGVFFIRGLGVSERLFSRLPISVMLRPACGALLLGMLGVGALMLSSSPELPLFYGTGYGTIRELLEPGWYVDPQTRQNLPVLATTALLLGILVAKTLATWLTLGSGGSGGLFAPGLLLGASLGGATGQMVSGLAWAPSGSPAHYALVGMAGMIAATAHAPLTAIMIVYEITRSYEMILPLMLAATVATIVARYLYPQSVYTAKLAAMGVRIGGTSDLPLLRRLVASDVPLLDPIVAYPDESAQRLIDLSEQTGVGDFVICNRDGDYLGMVTGVDLRRALVFREAIPLMQVGDLMRRDLPTVRSDETLDVVLEKFNSADVHCLVVLDSGRPRRVGGVIARSRLLRRYQQSLET